MRTSLIAFSWGFKQVSKKLLLLTVPCFCLFLSGYTFAAARPQSEPIVPACHIQLSSFLQPWGDHYSADVEEWEGVFKRHKELGFQTVILQWSHWGKRPYGEPVVPDWLKSALVAGRNTKVSLKIGTLYDPGFDRGLNGEKPIWYLKKHHDWNLAFASNLAGFLKLHPELIPAFSGWYISDEVDSSWLLNLSKKRLLTAYFQDMSTGLKRNISAPVSMTGYTQAAVVSPKLAERWAAFLNNTAVQTLYSQDGIGAELQTHNSAKKWNELLG
ncbi:DUF4434 domain-containing protein, partial [Rhodobacteraceae bacterium RKSG542]|uniref:DUF4434 domain-containing protein n=1 Tax=Pseudovibrio flavus TaxID=2529854 RepID=UPI0012BC705E